MIIRNPREQQFPWLQSYVTSDFVEPSEPRMIEVYSDKIVVVDMIDQEIGQADAMITKKKNITLQARSCDCGNLYYYDPMQWVIAVCHASWHNTKKNIVWKVVKNMESLWSDPHNIYVWTGPCISVKNYQFWPEVKELFEDKYYELRWQYYYLDLPLLHRDQLLWAWILAEHIIQSDICTFDTPELPSYRRQWPDSGRITWSIMQIA